MPTTTVGAYDIFCYLKNGPNIRAMNLGGHDLILYGYNDFGYIIIHLVDWNLIVMPTTTVCAYDIFCY